ncbi:MAG: DUF4124 domain-containing protein [Candidatus Berkiella sp.]
MNTKLSLILATCLLPLIANATVYEWQDAQGETHYGQEPGNVDAKIVKPNVAPVKTQNTAPQVEAKKEEPKKSEEQTKQVMDPKEIEALKINCERAKTHLQEMESKPRIKLQDAKGNVVFLTDEQRTQEIIKTKAAVEKYCNTH